LFNQKIRGLPLIFLLEINNMIYFDQFKNSISEIMEIDSKQKQLTNKRHKAEGRKYRFFESNFLSLLSRIPFFGFMAFFLLLSDFFESETFYNVFSFLCSTSVLILAYRLYLYLSYKYYVVKVNFLKMKKTNIVKKLKKEGHLDKKLYDEILNSLETFTNKEIDIVQDIIHTYNTELNNEKKRILLEEEKERNRIIEEEQKEALRIRQQEKERKIEKAREEEKKRRIGHIRDRYQFIDIEND
tara:strand:- start:26666 stop:27391 length:726 start_codon:yes stop_codon:yes gene_type:complete